MKKKLANLAFLLIMLASFSSLVGCGEKECEHNWNNGTITKQVTCTEYGEKTFKCQECTEVKVEKIEATGHSFSAEYSKDESNHWYECYCGEKKDFVSHIWDDVVITKNPSETEKGTTLYTCVCGQTREEDIAMLEHVHKFDDNLSYDDIHHWYPSTCGHDDSITKVEHVYNWTTQFDATCENAEVLLGTCECGHKITKDGQEALGHNYEVTYNWNGYKECQITLICKNDSNHIVNDKMTITSEVTKEASCTAEGSKLYTATFTYEGVTYTDETIETLEKKDHVYTGNKCDCGYEYYTSGLEYKLSEDETYYSVSGIGTSTDLNIYIPNIYNNLPVRRIDGRAFSFESFIKSVIIPDGVTSIGYEAFISCRSLSSITIPASMTSIGFGAFSSCDSLTSIEIPANVTSIGSNAFEYCSSLTSITIPNGVTSIEGYTFKDCSSLTSITIPDGVTFIGDYVFQRCSSLKSIKIPNNVPSIGQYAFYGCSSLESITIPASVTSIARNALNACSSLTSIVVDENNAVYDSRNNCNAIINTSTNELLFGCSTSIIPNSVTSIGNYAFNHCGSLTSIVIPVSVTSIGNYAFDGCDSLSNIYYTGSEQQWNDISVIEYFNPPLSSATITYNYVVVE